MKKYLFALAGLCAWGSLLAQPTFSDDFESYTAGQKLGPQSDVWTTWSNGDGGSEDTYVVNDNANSGSNSIYLSSSVATGGPSDVVLPLDSTYSLGHLTFEAHFDVQSGKGAYFNMQAVYPLGTTWALDCYMVNDGNLYLSKNNNVLLQTTYPTGQWFDYRLEINLNTSQWSLYVNDSLQGTFQNSVPSIAAIDIYPVNPANVGGNNQAGYWVDDVSYTYTPYTLPALNAAISSISSSDLLAGQTYTPAINVRNLGNNTITSFDLNVSYNGQNYMENVSNISLNSLATQSVSLSNPITIAAGAHNVVATVSNVNGNGPDNDASDDSSSITLDPIVPAPGKIVVGEEATGTWCGFCPRGIVAMEGLKSKYEGYWAGICIHNSDPMTAPVSQYDASMANHISGYPDGFVDRGTTEDPSSFPTTFLSRIVTPPADLITNGAMLNSDNSVLHVSMKNKFQSSISGNWKIVCVLTEDSVTGTGSGYNQHNYFANNTYGPMGGFENLPAVIPASQMVYDDVARAIYPSFNGYVNAFTNVNTGDSVIYDMSFNLNSGWDLSHMHIVCFAIDNTGHVDNAGYTTIDQAISNGYLEGNNIATGIKPVESPDAMLQLYPNPTASNAQLLLQLQNPEKVQVEVVNSLGKRVAYRNYQTLQGAQVLPVVTTGWSKGIYLIKVTIGNQYLVKKLVVK